MKCPNDQTEMEKGVVSIVGDQIVWNKTGAAFNTPNLAGKMVNGYRCPQCGKVELMTEPNK